MKSSKTSIATLRFTEINPHFWDKINTFILLFSRLIQRLPEDRIYLFNINTLFYLFIYFEYGDIYLPGQRYLPDFNFYFSYLICGK